MKKCFLFLVSTAKKFWRTLKVRLYGSLLRKIDIKIKMDDDIPEFITVWFVDKQGVAIHIAYLERVGLHGDVVSHDFAYHKGEDQ